MSRLTCRQVLQEIGHGTHGRVRLGRDMTESLPDADQIFYVGIGIWKCTHMRFRLSRLSTAIQRRRSSWDSAGRPAHEVMAARW